MSATSVERVSSPNHFAELHLTGSEPPTLVIGPSNYSAELCPNDFILLSAIRNITPVQATLCHLNAFGRHIFTCFWLLQLFGVAANTINASSWSSDPSSVRTNSHDYNKNNQLSTVITNQNPSSRKSTVKTSKIYFALRLSVQKFVILINLPKSQNIVPMYVRGRAISTVQTKSHNSFGWILQREASKNKIR